MRRVTAAFIALLIVPLVPLTSAVATPSGGGLAVGAVSDIAPGVRDGDRLLAKDALRDDLAGERFYFVMPDRFANGDSGNDRGGMAGDDRLKSGFDPTDKGFYHGGDLAGMHGKLDYLDDMGITAIWMTPMFANQWVQGSGANVSAAYHGYWTTDFTRLDPHFGTTEEMQRLISDAHGRGIKVFFDIVANHTADVIDYAEDTHEYVSTDAVPYLDAQGNPVDIAALAGKPDFPKFDAQTSFPYTPVVGTQVEKKPEWLNDPTLYHNRGDTTFSGESSEYGDFNGLDDLMTENPAVVEGMEKIFTSWIDTLGIDGYRVDTVKHVNMEFWQTLAPHVKDYAAKHGKRDFFVFGEVFSSDPTLTSAYTTTGRIQASLDFPFQSGALDFLAGKGAGRLGGMLLADDQYTDADSNASSLPTFLGNHDMGRIAWMLRQDRPGVGEDELLDRLKLGNALMYLWRGNPVVYYGDEQGFAGGGGDKLARQDLFASTTPEYAAEDLIGSDRTGAQDNFSTDHPLYRQFKDLASFVDSDPVWRKGNQVLRHSAGDILAFSRIDAGDQTEHLVVANAGTSATTADIPVAASGVRFATVWPSGGDGPTSGSDATVRVTVPPLSAVVLKATGTLPTAAPTPTLVVPPVGTVLDKRVELRADGVTSPFAQATFAARVDGAADWTFLGTDDAAPYRVFADLAGLPGAAVGKKVEFRVVAKDAKAGMGADGATVTLAAAVPPMSTAPADDDDLTKSKAVWVAKDLVVWDVPAVDSDGYQLHYDGKMLRLRPDSAQVPAKFPHLQGKPVFRVLPSDVDRVDEALRGRLSAVHVDSGGTVRHRTGVQIAGVLDDRYAAAAAALAYGPTFDRDRVSVRLWAPTAKSVKLRLFDRQVPPADARPSEVLDLTRDDASGSWSISGDWKDRYYQFEVTDSQRSVVVTDPYSVALSVNSTHSQFADLGDGLTMPGGWHEQVAKGLDGDPTEHGITELHLREFSIGDQSVPESDRGTYRAFTHDGSTGMTHLRELAKAGMDTVHLLPTFDIATIPEHRANQRQPQCDLASSPPDSPAQQECVAAVAAQDGFNWGYDPFHYDVPEGSYATEDAQSGWARSKQYREMVKSLHDNGNRVVVDVVYNHTAAAGDAPTSVLDKVVPGYYQRLGADGSIANSTCCANTATENVMMGKLVVDSVVRWARLYKVDGFRFDLMGHHPKANILAVRAALDTLTVGRDGVDGTKIRIYGEGWEFGEVAGNARFEQATQANMAGTGIGTFSDRLRDAVRGGGPFDADPRVQGLGSGLAGDLNDSPANGDVANRLANYTDLVKLGMAGNMADFRFRSTSGADVTGRQVDYNGSPAGYTGTPAEVITYSDAHDNETLYDALAFKLPQDTAMADRVRMQKVAQAPVLLGQGQPFMLAGSEFLRSKSLDRNSYDSGDWFNRYDPSLHANGFGSGLPPAQDNRDKWPYAQPLLASAVMNPATADLRTALGDTLELLRIRQSSPLFTLNDAAAVQAKLSFPAAGAGIVVAHLDDTVDADVDPARRGVLVIVNPYPQERTIALPGEGWRPHELSADAGRAHLAAGSVAVPARSVVVLVR